LRQPDDGDDDDLDAALRVALIEEEEGGGGPRYFHSDPTRQPKTVDDVIAMFTREHFYSFFRFSPEAVKEVITALRIPDKLTTANKRCGLTYSPLLYLRTLLVAARSYFNTLFCCARAHSRPTIDGGVAFLMLLFRWSGPVKLRPHMEYVWGYDKTYMCDWTNAIMMHLNETWGHVLRMDTAYVSQQAPTWAQRVGAKLGPEPASMAMCRCILFVDGVFRYCCRPMLYEVRAFSY
jgi:hypothetical protein